MAEDLKQKTSKGLLWNLIHNFSMQGINFLLMLFMARLLSPSDYGTIGLIAVFIAVAGTFIDSGFATALIRKKDRTQTDLSTIFFFNIVMAVVCYAIIFVCAPFVAKFYDLPVLTLILRVLAINILLGSVNTVQVARLNYTMNFKKQAMISITHTSISGIVGLICAFAGMGVWALVTQQLTQGLVGVILIWTLCDWKPTWEFSVDSLKSMFGFSSRLLATRLLDTIYGNIYPIVIGKCFSPAALGHYSRAQHWASFPSTNLTNVLMNVTFASLSQIHDENERLARVYRKMIKTSAFIIFPMMIGLSAVAKPLIVFTIGEKWEFCSQILQIICFSYMISPLLSLNTNLLQVKGRSDLSLRLSIIEKVFALVVLVVSVPLGLLAMCYFGIITTVLMLFINTFYIGRLIGVGLVTQIRDILPSFALGMVMFASLYLLMPVCTTLIGAGDSSFVQLLVGVIIGAIIYLLPAYLLKFEELGDALSMLKGMLKK